MIEGDYTARKRKTKTGKIIVDKIVKSTTGVEYAIGNRLGSGGVASVFRARRVRDKKECVFKEYVPSPESRRLHIAIKRNIQNLMKNPLTEDDGVTPLCTFIGPMDTDSLIELPVSGGFGYVMELVDTKAFLSVPKLWHRDTYPDADILCRACINIARFFRKVHFKGWCYKDINEGNIYINNKTGDIRIIDCDNISVQSTKTIKGTDGFMAPEVYITSAPDAYTDYFSMAVLFYRLFVGGFPMDGKRTRGYLLAKNLSIQEAAPDIYGKMALFAFDPNNKSNEIRGLVDPQSPRMYEMQVRKWDRLPEAIKDRFVQTFANGLSSADRHKRATDREWMTTFERIKTTGLVRCRCGKVNFGEANKKVECIFCKAGLPQLAVRRPFAAGELTAVEFSARRDIAPTRLKIVARRRQRLQGNAIYPGLNEGWMRIEYSKKRNMLSVVNLSRYIWSISDNGSRAKCAPGERVIVKVGLVITVMYRQLQLTVADIR